MTPLQKNVYTLLRLVPKGHVTTYKDLAHAAGTKAYRAIGQFMRNNPYAPGVPCHRVVTSTGSIGGFKGKKDGKEILEKIKLLETEGVTVRNGKIQDFEDILFSNFSTSGIDR